MKNNYFFISNIILNFILILFGLYFLTILLCISSSIFYMFRKKIKLFFIFLLLVPTFYYFNKILDIYVFTHSDIKNKLFIVLKNLENNQELINDKNYIDNDDYFLQIDNLINYKKIDYQDTDIYLRQIIQGKKIFFIKSKNYCFAFNAYYSDYLMPKKIYFRMVKEFKCENLKYHEILKINNIFIFKNKVI